jgi:hypothetical protein
MPILSLSNDQVIELVKQLPRTQQEELLKILLTQPWYSWKKLTHDSTDKARFAATKRGRNWDLMTEDEPEMFIDEILHEDKL